MPSKLTAIGAFVGVLSLIISVISILPNNFSFKKIFFIKNNKTVTLAPKDVQSSNNFSERINEGTIIDNQSRIIILDNNLYIARDFTKLVIGGPNCKAIKLSARAKDGASLPIFRYHFTNSITFDKEDEVLGIESIFQSPYIEFEYKYKFYSLKIEMKLILPEDYKLNYVVSQIQSSSMLLTSYENISFKNID